ncbi:MAG: PAS domain S-box protein [bacterium]|nr:PAS domain S-box protein [bacterium]
MTGRNVLIVEDESIIARDLEIRLKAIGYRCAGIVSSGEKAIEAAGKRDIDLVLMDIHLQGRIDGIEAARRLQQDFRLPVVFLSGYSDRSTLEHVKKSNPYGFLNKPLGDNRDLRTAVEIALNKHRLERVLQEREAWLSTVLRDIADGVVATDPTGRVAFMNPVAESLTGWSSRDAAGKPVRSVLRIVDGRTKRPTEHPFIRLLRSGRLREFPPGSALIRKNLKAVPVDGSGSLIHNQKGKLWGSVLVVRDITERKKAEEEVRLARRRFEAIFNSSIDGMLHVDAGGKIRQINPALLRITDEPESTFIGKSLIGLVRRFFGPKRSRESVHLIGQMLSGREIPPSEIKFRSRVLEFRAGAVADLGGYVVFVRDVTARREAEKALRESEQKFRAMADQAPIMIGVSDASGAISFLNKAWMDLRGRTVEEEAGGTWAADLHPEDGDRVRRIMQSSVRRRRPYSVEYRIRDRFGKYRWIMETAAPMRDPDARLLGYIGTAVDLTDRKQTEEALRHTVLQLNGIFQALPDLYFRMEPDGTIVDYKAGRRRDLYLKPEAFLGRRMQDVLPQEAAAKFNSALGELASGTPYATIEYVLPLAAGKQVFEARLLILENGQVIAFVRDITERKTVENALRDREFWLIESQRAAGVGSYVFDVPGGVWSSSAALDELFGIDARYERTVNGWAELIHPEERERMIRYLNEVAIPGLRFDMDYRIRRRSDGEERWVMGLGRFDTDEKGRPVRMYGTIQDITERKRAEEAQRASEIRYRLLFETAHDGIGISDGGRIVEANNRLALMLGYEPSELIGLPIPDLFAPELREWIESHVPEDASTPEEHIALRRDGFRLPVEVQSWTIPYKGRHARVTVIRDITEHKKAQEAVENTERAFRLASIGTLAAGISHEVNQPLTALKVKVDGMLYWGEKDPETISRNLLPNLKFISAEAEKIDGIIRHMRSLIRRDKMPPSPVDLTLVVRKTVSAMRYQLASHNIHLIVRSGKKPVLAMADETSVEQVVLNLVSNAMKALDRLDRNEKKIVIAARAGVSKAVLAVSDTGPGIPDEIRGRIFEPLYSTESKGASMGLGLAIVRFFVEEHGGTIRVRNRASGGASFIIAYPKSAGLSAEAE